MGKYDEGKPVEPSQEDPEELTTDDFQQAANTAQVKSLAQPQLQWSCKAGVECRTGAYSALKRLEPTVISTMPGDPQQSCKEHTRRRSKCAGKLAAAAPAWFKRRPRSQRLQVRSRYFVLIILHKLPVQSSVTSWYAAGLLQLKQRLRPRPTRNRSTRTSGDEDTTCIYCNLNTVQMQGVTP